MEVSRASATPERGARVLGLAFAASCGVALLLGAICWGFTVDDALITCRYAHHLATGSGYVMNVGEPASDGVTPLGFAYVLMPFAGASAERALIAAKCIGLLAHALGAGVLGMAIARSGGRHSRWAALAAYLAALPVAAWSVAGLETGLVEGLIAGGASLRVLGVADKTAIVLLGCAAGLRPELLPMVVLLAGPRAVTDPDPTFGLRAFGRLALASAPFLAAATIRAIAFGRPAPLSALAKRPDIALGLRYAVASCLLTGLVGVVAPLAWRQCDRFTRWLTVAVVGHAAAVTFAGGDWMPISRLFVPALPVAALAVAGIARASRPGFVWLRLVLALAGEGFVWVTLAEKVVRVGADRQQLIDQLRAPLSDTKVIATLDIGFVGAAAPHAKIVDLAGVTDPEIAVLPGTHTDKRIPDGLLAARHVDAIVFQLHDGSELADPWWSSRFARGVERYVALEPGVGERFTVRLVTQGRLRYAVLCNNPEPTPDRP